MQYKDSLEAWRVLIAAAKTGSISQTAVLCDTDPARASKMITGLEKEIGSILFDRRRRPMKPTAKCRALLAAVEPLVSDFDDAWAVYSESAGQRIIRFAAPIDLARLYFSELLVRYTEMHPETAFNILPEAAPDAVREGRTDAAIINFMPADTSGLVLRRYNSSTTCLLATPEYLRVHGSPAQPADLANHTGLLLETVMHPATSVLWRDGSPSPLLRWRNVFITHDQMTLRQMLLEHRGITVDLYAGHMIPEIKAGTVVPIMPGWRREPWEMSVVTSIDGERRSKRLADFALFVAEEAGKEWRSVRREADAAVAEAFRRRLGS